MHIHILGICGTFMGGLALLARAHGHKVTGSDTHVYPPMSTLLEEQQIDIIQGYSVAQLEPIPDLVIIGNALSRGNACVEAVLNQKIPYTSGPQWLRDSILKDRWVIAIAGTHGKTTVSGMVAWILTHCGCQPSFLIGGIPGNFDVSAKWTNSPFFVIEADEYDCAFFDKRSKFVHYLPKTLVLNNLEFDHADIFDSLADIQRQVHHLIRIVPSNGKIIYPVDDENIQQTLAKGCWSELEAVGNFDGWGVELLKLDASAYRVMHQGKSVGEVHWSLVGQHNMQNGLMAIVAACHTGLKPEKACEALNSFINAKRRLELKGSVDNIQIYDDFAHHPTAILATLSALRSKVGKSEKIFAVLEPRSNTMKLGMNKNEIASSLWDADRVFLFQPSGISWHVSDIAEHCLQPVYCSDDAEDFVEQITSIAKPGDHILVMSNGSFNGIHNKLLESLQKRAHKNSSTL